MSATPAIKAILFGMDGVLVDVSRSYRRAIEETATHFTGRFFEPGAVQRYKNLGGFSDDWKLTHAMITDAGMEVSLSRVVEELQHRYRGENWDGFIAEEPALVEAETLAALCRGGRTLGIVTNRPEAEARWTLDRFGWKRYFPLVVGRERQEGRTKPEAFPLLHALGILAAAGRPVQPEEAAYVGDSVDDMAAARAAGLWAVGVVPPYLDADAHAELLYARGAHVVAENSKALPDVLDRLPLAVAETTS